MSIYWIVGSIYFYFTREIRYSLNKKPDINVDELEGITFYLPVITKVKRLKIRCLMFLHSNTRKKKLLSLMMEVQIIQQNSSIRLKKIMTLFSSIYKKTEVKANALNQGIKQASYDYVMCLDADTIVDQDAPYYMIENFKHDPKLGAVTGNPRIRNKSSILGKIQTIEYASLIGCIKRSQTLAGAVNTISGVFTLFKKCSCRRWLLGY